MPGSPPKRNDRGVAADPWLIVARVVRSRGNRGEVLAEIETDWPEERLVPGPATFRGPKGDLTERIVEDVWFHKDRVVIKIEGLNDISDAEALRDAEWVVPEEDRMPLPEGSFYRYAVEGMEAVDEEGNHLGEVVTIQEGAGGDLLVLRIGGDEVLVPAARDFIRSVDENARRMVLSLPAELATLND